MPSVSDATKEGGKRMVDMSLKVLGYIEYFIKTKVLSCSHEEDVTNLAVINRCFGYHRIDPRQKR